MLLIGGVGGLGFAVVVAGGSVERIVFITNADIRPVTCRASIVNAHQTSAIVEREVSDARHAIWYRDTRQTTTTEECISTDARHTTICWNYTTLASSNQSFALSFDQAVPF